MNEKNFDFVMQAAMLNSASCSEVEKLRNYIRDVKTVSDPVSGEELCVPVSGKTASVEDLRKPEETTAEHAGITQSPHRDGESVRIPRVVT